MSLSTNYLLFLSFVLFLCVGAILFYAWLCRRYPNPTHKLDASVASVVADSVKTREDIEKIYAYTAEVMNKQTAQQEVLNNLSMSMGFKIDTRTAKK